MVLSTVCGWWLAAVSSLTHLHVARDGPQAGQVVVMLDLVNSGLKPISTVVDAGVDGV